MPPSTSIGDPVRRPAYSGAARERPKQSRARSSSGGSENSEHDNRRFVVRSSFGYCAQRSPRCAQTARGESTQCSRPAALREVEGWLDKYSGVRLRV